MVEQRKEQFETHKPMAAALLPYIAYYYFNASAEEDYTKRFLFYPHYRNALTIYKNSIVRFGSVQSYVEPHAEKSYEIIYTGINEFCRMGQIKAPFNKIGVVFQPLGINHFLPGPLSEVQREKAKGDFSAFGPDFKEVLDRVYTTKKIESKVKLLDEFFVSQLRDLLDSRLLRAVDMMFEGDYFVKEIAESLGVSRKTLQRLFNIHLNCSPKTYLNIIKFRRAIGIYHERKSSLTDIAYKNDYYDQSDFIKHFKKVTGFNPGRFFKSISHLGNEDTFWTELEDEGAVPFLQF